VPGKGWKKRTDLLAFENENKVVYRRDEKDNGGQFIVQTSTKRNPISMKAIGNKIFALTWRGGSATDLINLEFGEDKDVMEVRYNANANEKIPLGGLGGTVPGFDAGRTNTVREFLVHYKKPGKDALVRIAVDEKTDLEKQRPEIDRLIKSIQF